MWVPMMGPQTTPHVHGPELNRAGKRSRFRHPLLAICQMSLFPSDLAVKPEAMKFCFEKYLLLLALTSEFSSPLMTYIPQTSQTHGSPSTCRPVVIRTCGNNCQEAPQSTLINMGKMGNWLCSVISAYALHPIANTKIHCSRSSRKSIRTS